MFLYQIESKVQRTTAVASKKQASKAARWVWTPDEAEQDRGRFAGRRESGERQDATDAAEYTLVLAHGLFFRNRAEKSERGQARTRSTIVPHGRAATARFRVGNERLHSLTSSFEQNQAARNCFFLRGPLALVRRTRRCRTTVISASSVRPAAGRRKEGDKTGLEQRARAQAPQNSIACRRQEAGRSATVRRYVGPC